MRIKNKSHWNSKQIRSLTRLVVKEVGIDESLCKSIEIETGKKSNRMETRWMYGGVAHLFWNTITLRVPNIVCDDIQVGTDGKWSRIKKEVMFDPVAFAQVLTHELHHLMGIRSHRDMQKWWTLDCEYVKGFVVTANQNL